MTRLPSRLFVLCVFASVLGCGGSATVAGTPTCGTPPQSAAAAECADLTQCGAGPSNLQKVSFCENCFARSDSHVCEAGTCRATAGIGTLLVRFSKAGIGAGAQSVAMAAVLPVMADGTRLSCAKLLSTCAWRDNALINANATSALIQMAGDVAQVPISVEAGADRLLFLALTSEPQGRGRVVAKGCTEGLQVASGPPTLVAVELVAP